MERELPIIQIEGTAFILDVFKEELREKANPQNIMRVQKMSCVGDGYSFSYDTETKNFPFNEIEDTFSSTINYIDVKLPELVKLDPVGMAQKYNLSIEEVKEKTDIECMVTQGPFDLRWNKKILPTLEIHGHTFYVDLNMDKLRPKDDFQSKGIDLNEIREYYDRSRQAYLIPYNPKTHEFQEIDHLTITELPKDIVIVQFQHQYELDRVGWNKKHGFDIRRGLEPGGTELHFKSRTLPWNETNIPRSITINLQEKRLKEQENLKEEITPSKQFNDRGRKL